MDVSDLPLVVPLSAFADFLNCSICMNQLKSTHTTPCGHRYCEDCIKEWVNRKHNCPCCNQPVQSDQLMKDHQYDGLIACLMTEKDKSETEYFGKLLSQATSSSSEGKPDNLIESVLKKHLIQSLAAYEKLYQDMNKTFLKKQEELRNETKMAVSDLQNHGLSIEEISSQTTDLQKTLDLQLENASKELSTCLSLIATSYDKYLSSHLPSLDLLPVNVSVYLLEKDIVIPNVNLAPKDSLSDVLTIIKSYMEQQNDPIVSIGEDLIWLVFGPMAKGNSWEMSAIAEDVKEKGMCHHDGVTMVMDQSMLSVQYSIRPNSALAVCGTIKCNSDLPKKCFVNIFKAGESKAVDYFSCKTCGFNWVCRSCKEVCHKDHSVVPYIMNHQPTWACCYCPKKKTCCIADVD